MKSLQDAVFEFGHEAGSCLLIVTSISELLQRDANLTAEQRADLVRVHRAAMDLHQHVRALRGRAELEAASGQQREIAHEQLAHDLGERVKELRLLHAAARVLQETRPFDRSVLDELVTMMPAAWKHSACCQARITYEDVSAATAGWRDTPWRQAAAFTTSAGSGAVEVGYLEEQASADEGPFLAEERTLIESIAEMLAAYLEHDIAARRRSQLETQLRQAQQMEALGTLAGGIAHDFNNLLTAIGSNADLALTDAAATPGVRAHLIEVKKAHARASDLVKRVLLFSRRQDADRRPTDLAPVIDEAVRLLRAGLPPTIEIRFQAQPDLPVVLADASQMHQVVMNLGTNALQAMGERGGLLHIGLDAQGSYVRISVRDTGTGIDPEIRPRLFEPFFTTKGASGTGLGLSVVHGIVTDHGGAITVESEVGAGSSFHVLLPAVSGAADPEPAIPDIAQGNGEHVMYVDDEEAIVVVMERVLNRLGYRCTGYTNPADALQAFRANPDGYAAVITDMTMPGMSGAAFAEELRAMRPDLPVAIASGYESAERAASAAGLMRIAKPVSMEGLSQSLRALLRKPVAS